MIIDTNIKIKSINDYSIVEEFLNDNFSSPTHWPKWNILISKYFNTDFLYYLAFSGNELIGICPLHKLRHGILNSYYSGQFHYIPNGGWIFSKPTIIDYNFFPKGKLRSLKIYCLPDLNYYNTIYLDKIISQKAETLILDLTNTLDTIWEKQFDHKKRTQVRKAEKSGLIVEQWSLNNIQQFYEFYKIVNQGYGLKNLQLDLFKELLHVSGNIYFEIFAVLLENSLLSTAAIIYDKDTSIFWLAHNDKNKTNFGQSEMLIWDLIKHAKSQGCKYFDLSYVDKKLLYSLYMYKKGFSKTVVPVYVINERPFLYKILNRISKIKV